MISPLPPIFFQETPPLLPLVKGGVAFSLCYHSVTGVRHLVWDRTAWGVTVPQVAKTSTAALAFTLAVTAGFMVYKIEE